MSDQLDTGASPALDGILARLRARDQLRFRGVRGVRVLDGREKKPTIIDEPAGALRKPRADVEHVVADLQAPGIVCSGSLIPGRAGSLIVHRLAGASA
ncbi:hypothetical protein [Aquimonas sp.]|jgi:hypothetical protein|uniref:hypothetical protein n=1 Tax=Aquimonas sp. TaxID=1872588 RepID=UPI0037C1A859